LNVPVLVTWKAIDIYTNDQKLFRGRPGIIGSKFANSLQQQSDLIICIGARLDLGQIAYNQKNFGYNSKKIVVDID